MTERLSTTWQAGFSGRLRTVSYGASEDNLLVYVRDADDAIWARQEYARAGQ